MPTTRANPYIVTPELVTAPTTEPVTLDELKTHLRVDGPDDDTLILAMSMAARQWFEVALDRQLATATWRIKLPWFMGWCIELPYPPLRSVGSITYKDSGLVTQTLATSVYDVITYQTPGVVQPKYGQSWPSTGTNPAAVTITFDAGYGADLPGLELVTAGIKMLVGNWYDPGRGATTAFEQKAVPFGVDSIVAATRAMRF